MVFFASASSIRDWVEFVAIPALGNIGHVHLERYSECRRCVEDKVDTLLPYLGSNLRNVSVNESFLDSQLYFSQRSLDVFVKHDKKLNSGSNRDPNVTFHHYHLVSILNHEKSGTPAYNDSEIVAEIAAVVVTQLRNRENGKGPSRDAVLDSLKSLLCRVHLQWYSCVFNHPHPQACERHLIPMFLRENFMPLFEVCVCGSVRLEPDKSLLSLALSLAYGYSCITVGVERWVRPRKK
jgi:hypothetical protein